MRRITLLAFRFAERWASGRENVGIQVPRMALTRSLYWGRLYVSAIYAMVDSNQP